MRVVTAVLVGVVGAVGVARPAAANSGGVNGGGCGCHGDGEVNLDVNISPMMFSPGDQVTVTVTVAQPGGNVAGVFVDDDNDVGVFEAIGGQGLAVVLAGMTHTFPKSMGGGSAQWSFRWTAPGSPGAVRFSIWGLSANGNGSASGDDAALAEFDFTFGCEGQEYYRDADGDGYGRTNATLVHCQGLAPAGYAELPGDCDDNDPDQYPGAVEYCNQVDDDCDDVVDEDAVPLELFPDADGDGYYSQLEYESGKTLLGCIPTEGWAAEPGDCRPNDPEIHPGVEETCNGLDDNCDNDIDEFVRPQCGEGWCRREALGCDGINCTPGEPREEACNFFDDDCDGIVDNDAVCPAGELCQAGECRAQASTAEDGGESVGSSGLPAVTGGTGSSAGVAGDDGDGCGCSAAPRGSVVAWWCVALVGVARRGRRLRQKRTD